MVLKSLKICSIKLKAPQHQKLDFKTPWNKLAIIYTLIELKPEIYITAINKLATSCRN